MDLIACTNYEQHAITPRKPVDKAGDGANGSIEGKRPVADRQIDDANGRRDSRFSALTFEDASNCAVDDIDEEDVFGNRLSALGPPIALVRSKDRPNVQRTREWRCIHFEFPTYDQRSHRGAMLTFARWIFGRPPVRIINNQVT